MAPPLTLALALHLLLHLAPHLVEIASESPSAILYSGPRIEK